MGPIDVLSCIIRCFTEIVNVYGIFAPNVLTRSLRNLVTRFAEINIRKRWRESVVV